MISSRALVLKEYGKFEQASIEVPPPGDHEVVVRVAATGICGSDLHGYTGENGRRHPGQIMGHETAGKVESLGAMVTDLTVGQEVTINPVMLPADFGDEYVGREQHHPEKKVLGVSPEINAAFADRVLVPAQNVVALPDGLPLTQGALIEPLAVATHAIERSGGVEGLAVAIIGGGPIGQSIVLAAQAAGATRVIVSEPDAGRRALCDALGATSVKLDDATIAHVLADQLAGGAMVVFDAVGIDSTIRDAFALSQTGSTICLVGMGSPRFSLDAYEVSVQERVIVGSFTYSHSNFAAAVELAGRSSAALDLMVSQEISLSEADGAFARLAAGDTVPGKILVRFDR